LKSKKDFWMSIHYYNHYIVEYNWQKFNFKLCEKTEDTAHKNNLVKLQTEIKTKSWINISIYDIENIIEHFNITSK
jgi:hypothetical protein